MSTNKDGEPSRRPDDTPFKQQKLKAWQPILTPAWVIGTYFLVGLIFVPIGVVLYQQNLDVVEMAIQYDGLDSSSGLATLGASVQNLSPTSSCSLPNDSDGNSFNLTKHGCIVSFKLQEDMKAPIMVYYQLDNFYQNHRRYVQSRSDAQLRAQPLSSPPTTCDGANETTEFKYNSIDDLPATAVRQKYKLNPCGLIANSLFNDIFWVHSVSLPTGQYLNQTDVYAGNTTVVNLMDQSDLAWKSDLETKFNNYDTLEDDNLYLWQNPKYRWIIPSKVGQEPILNKTAWTKPTTHYGVETERFVLWMRTAGLPNFRKKYGRINTDLPKGTVLRFLISSNFPVQSFEGRKSLVISTLSWYGGQNAFLGLAYIVVGGICILLSLFFFIKHKLSPRKLGDTNYLVWRGNKPT
ncbi:hypothetical protein H310_06574 [Aphanomyces invadans]|uniref:ALA-interacting subunit n=1 Tax=Aphanomyces invadans TaxID=157072 RepID=A0A024U3F0_9STRA|nr:hypothetical protein H310_06574 [Aphanomyces invadans]ETW00916.1 hypothetical protein H310_06574 [Aphanomyces invadans]|eukprot:XP_008869914.1 hypothetical protein H310_06574 [Aphanomyces invadans]